jgi:hypothetical protein
MGHRIRLAMQRGSQTTMRGEVEIDETFIGGKAHFMHKGKRAAKIKGTGGMRKERSASTRGRPTTAAASWPRSVPSSGDASPIRV